MDHLTVSARTPQQRVDLCHNEHASDLHGHLSYRSCFTLRHVGETDLDSIVHDLGTRNPVAPRLVVSELAIRAAHRGDSHRLSPDVTDSTFETLSVTGSSGW